LIRTTNNVNNSRKCTIEIDQVQLFLVAMLVFMVRMLAAFALAPMMCVRASTVVMAAVLVVMLAMLVAMLSALLLVMLMCVFSRGCGDGDDCSIAKERLGTVTVAEMAALAKVEW
jgi:hypothetical protein